MKNGCPVCRNVNELTATQCRYCGAALTPPQPPAPPVARQRRRWPLALGGAAVVVLAIVAGFIGFSGSSTAAPSVTAKTYEVATDAGTALKFDPATFDVPANTKVQINFTNKSQGLPHNMTFQSGVDAKTADQVAAGQTATLSFTTPGPGSYKYVCTIHPGMEGTMNVK